MEIACNPEICLKSRFQQPILLVLCRVERVTWGLGFVFLVYTFVEELWIWLTGSLLWWRSGKPAGAVVWCTPGPGPHPLPDRDIYFIPLGLTVLDTGMMLLAVTCPPSAPPHHQDFRI